MSLSIEFPCKLETTAEARSLWVRIAPLGLPSSQRYQRLVNRESKRDDVPVVPEV